VFDLIDYSNYYYLILGLQGFCLYHAYKNNNQQKWYYLIIFLPIIGSLIYLYENFYSRRNVSNVTEGMKGILNSNHTIEKLEKTVKFSDTHTNKMNLADAYVEKGRLDEAIHIYESCRNGIYADNVELFQKLSHAYYLKKDYPKVIELSKKLNPVGENNINFAWALHYAGDSVKSEEKFKEMNRRFSNFQGRLEYSKFLLEKDRKEDAYNLLCDIIEEYDSMTNYEKNLKKGIVGEVKRVLKTIK
jgi:hypothetical protein